MIRRTALRARRPLRRGSALRSASALRTVTTLSRSQLWQGRPEDTGPDRKTRLLVLKRDGWACVGCGRSVIGWQYTLRRRRARRSGGADRPCNLVALCAGCHFAAGQRDPLMHAAGLWLASTEDPREVPVMLRNMDGCRVWLAQSGTYSATPPGDEMP